MKRNTRLMSLLLAALTLACAVSCGDTKTPDSGNVTTDIQPEETTVDVFNGLERKDYGGREFNFVIRDDKWSLYVVEEMTGDVLDDAIYRTQHTVEEEFGTKINYIQLQDDPKNRGSYLTTIRASIQSGDGAFDLVDGYAAFIGGLYADHLFMNLYDVPGLRLGEEWWSKLVLDELTVNGRIYSMVGDLSQTTYQNLLVTFFNKDMFDDLQYEAPYQLVRDGKWTFDAYKKLVKGAARDLNGDGVMDQSDIWGVVFTDDIGLDNFHYQYGIFYTERAADGTVSANLMSEKLVSLYDEFSAFLATPDVFPTYTFATAQDIFYNKRALFMTNTPLGQAIGMRDEEVEFGILPSPKGSEEQEYYYTSARDGRTMVCVPVDVRDAEFAGTITEALCSASHEIMIPAFYNIALKGKSTRDDESGEMIDIARAGLVFDFVEEHAAQMQRAGWIFRDCIANKRDLSSYYASNEAKFRAAFDSFVETYYD